MWPDPIRVTLVATAVFAGVWAYTRRTDRLSGFVFLGLLFNLVFVTFFFHPQFQNIVIGKDIGAQVVVFTLFLIWLSHAMRKGEYLLPPSPLNIAVFVLFSAGILSALLAPRWTWYYTLEEVARSTAVYLMFFLIIRFLHTRTRWDAAFYALVTCMALTSVYAIIQMNGLDFVEWGRIVNVSTFGNKDFFASFLTYTLPLTVFLALGSRNLFDAFLYAALSAVALYNIIAGETRGAWLGLIALAATVLWFETTHGRISRVLTTVRRRWTFWVSLAGICVALASAAPEKKMDTFRSIFQTGSGTNIIRVYIWWSSMRMWWDQPVLGQGIGTYQLTYPFFRPDRYNRIGMSHNTRHAHSEELEVLSEQGIFGFAAWASVFLIFFIIGFRKLRRIPEMRDRYIFFGIISSLITGLVHDSFNVNLRWMSSAVACWFVLGLGARYLAGFDAPRAKNPPRPPDAPGRNIYLREAPLGFALAAVFAFMFWGEYRVLYADHILRVVEGTAEISSAQPVAIEKSRDVLDLVPYDHSALYKSAYAFLQQNRFDQAREMYARLLNLAPNYAQVHQNTALLAYHQYLASRRMKYLHQTMLEFEWACLHENNFINHSKLLQLYAQDRKDLSRARYHNRFLRWNAEEDAVFAQTRYWQSASQPHQNERGRQSAYQEWVSPIIDFNQQYWLYRTDAAAKSGRTADEIWVALKMSLRYVPDNATVLQSAAHLVVEGNSEREWLYIVNMIERLAPGDLPPYMLSSVRSTLSVRSKDQPLAAYAMGVLSHRMGEMAAAREYFAEAKTSALRYRAVRDGIKKYEG